MNGAPAQAELKAERISARLLAPGLVGAALVVAAGLATYAWLPPPSQDPTSVAWGWLALAALLGPAMAVDAVAHERLQTDAFDPLAGHTTRRLQVNSRFLQNTLEQFVLFAIGLLALAADGLGNREFAVRVLGGLTVSWLAARYLFWIGYHRASGLRVLGIVGLVLPAAMLAIAAARFGDRAWSTIGLAAPLIVLAVVEGVLFWGTRDRTR